jgi:hypothetical protein
MWIRWIRIWIRIRNTALHRKCLLVAQKFKPCKLKNSRSIIGSRSKGASVRIKLCTELEHPSPGELDLIDRLVAAEMSEPAKRLTHIVQVHTREFLYFFKGILSY